MFRAQPFTKRWKMEHYLFTQSWHSRRHSILTYGFLDLIFELLDMLLLSHGLQLHSYFRCNTRTDAKFVIYTLRPVTAQSFHSISSTLMDLLSALCPSKSYASQGTSQCEPAECAIPGPCKATSVFPVRN